jgi:hypothetical protein
VAFAQEAVLFVGRAGAPADVVGCVVFLACSVGRTYLVSREWDEMGGDSGRAYCASSGLTTCIPSSLTKMEAEPPMLS